MDPERVKAYLQAACAGLGFDVGEIWWTSGNAVPSAVTVSGKFPGGGDYFRLPKKGRKRRKSTEIVSFRTGPTDFVTFDLFDWLICVRVNAALLPLGSHLTPFRCLPPPPPQMVLGGLL